VSDESALRPVQLRTAPPKTKQIADILRAQIESGELAPGARVYSLRTLSEQYGVSAAVVVSAFKILEKNGLIYREAGRGTFVRPLPESCRKTIALLTTYDNNAIEGYFEVIARQSYGRGCLTIPVNLLDHPRLDQALEIVRARRPDVWVVDVEGRGCSVAEVETLIGDSQAIYMHRWEWLDKPKIDAVLLDLVASYVTAIRVLIEKGHRRILFAGHHVEPQPYLLRIIREVAQELGLDFGSPEFRYLSYRHYEADRRHFSAVMSGTDCPTAIFGMSDHVLRQMLYRASLCNAKVPQDVIGMYDTSWSRVPGQEFSSLHVDFSAMWDKVLSHVFNEAAESVEWVVPELIVR